MNEDAQAIIDSMNTASEEWAKQQEQEDSAHWAAYISSRDHIAANWKERLLTMGVDANSEVVLITWALATYTAEEHMRQFCTLWEHITGLPTKTFFPEGLLMHSMWEVTQT